LNCQFPLPFKVGCVICRPHIASRFAIAFFRGFFSPFVRCALFAFQTLADVKVTPIQFWLVRLPPTRFFASSPLSGPGAHKMLDLWAPCPLTTSVAVALWEPSWDCFLSCPPLFLEPLCSGGSSHIYVPSNRFFDATFAGTRCLFWLSSFFFVSAFTPTKLPSLPVALKDSVFYFVIRCFGPLDYVSLLLMSRRSGF